MAALRPTCSITAGAYRATTDNPVGGPVALTILRDLDTPADGLELMLADRAGIAADDDMTVDLGDGASEARVFTGTVVEVRPTLDGCRVRGLGHMSRLLRLHVASHYEGKTAGAIVRDVIAQADLAAATVDDGPSLPAFTIDRRQSAHAHLRGLAERLGFAFGTDRQGKVMFRGLGAAAGLDAGPAALAGALAVAAGLAGESFRFGEHLVAAGARRRGAGIGSIRVTGESPTSSKGYSASAWLSAGAEEAQGSAGSGEPILALLDPAARTRDLAARFAAGRLAGNTRDTRRIAITVLGRPALDLGDPVTVAGLADDLDNGSGYVAAIRHRFGAGVGFLTDLAVVAGAA
jgi:hypothetical protein